MPQIADRMTTLGTETAFEVLARANALAAQADGKSSSPTHGRSSSLQSRNRAKI